MVELNVLGLLYCAHAAMPHLLRAAEDGPRQVADMVNISSVAGRAARNGNGVYSLTKFGVGAFSESLRQEVAKRYVRVSLVEPGATATELATHNRPEVLESIRGQFGQRMEASDIADAITYIVTRPRHVAVNEILIRPTEQERYAGRCVDLGLDGKVAIVGGSSKGLGKASALALAREGARVTICARTQDDLQAADEQIQRETGADVLAVAADLATAAGVENVVAETIARFSGVDVLVANSGGPALGRFATSPMTTGGKHSRSSR